MISPQYLAGIIDGEGSIFNRRQGNIHVSVANTSKALIDALGELGGHTHSRDPRRGLGTLPSWEWTACGETAAIIVRACLPYLVIKADKARECLQVWEGDGIERSNRKHFKRVAREAMNQRGWPEVAA